MTETVGQMTPSELGDLIENILEQKLLEMLKDPDTRLELNEDVLKRLQQQQKSVYQGDRGLSLDDARRQLLGS